MHTYTSPDEVLVFKVTLNDSMPRVWRRIAVPAAYTFFDLHCAIQNAMGWTDSHLHAFLIDTRGQSKSKRREGRGDLITIEYPNPKADSGSFGDESKDERVERIADWFGKSITQCMYEYDFGDGWNHTVLFEKRVTTESGVRYPKCLEGKNACPPEDCGGMGGYDYLQNVLQDPKHEEYADMRDWLGIKTAKEFDPEEFDPADVKFENSRKRLKEYIKGFA